MFENPRRDRQARNFTTNVPKILVLKWSSKQIFSRKLPLGDPESTLVQMAFYSNKYALLVQRLEKILALKMAPKVPEWPRYCNLSKLTQNTHFLKKWKGGTKETFSKIAPKVSLRLKGPKALWRKWHYPRTSMHLKCKDWRRFLQYHPKPAFSKKVQRGHQDKFFKKRPKSSPRLKGPKALFHKWHYPLISMHLKGKDWKRFWGKNAAPKVPEWPSYRHFRKVSHNPHFLKKCKGGIKGNFSKIAQKVALVWKAQTHSAANGIIH